MPEQLYAEKGLNKVEGAPPSVTEAKPVSQPRPDASPELLELKNRHLIRLLLCVFLIVALGYSVHRCFSLIFFYVEHGHQISEGFLKFLCGATVAQIAVMLGVFVRAVWPDGSKNPRRSAG